MDETAIHQLATPPRTRAAVAATIALAVVLGVIALLLWQYGRITSNLRPAPRVAEQVRTELSPEPMVVEERSAAPERPERLQTPPTYVLVMGSEGGTGSPLSTLMLVRLAGDDVKASVLWVPPKAVVRAGGRTGSVSDAFAAGGPAAAIRRVKEITGLPVHHYVRFRPAGLAEALDAMGGVRVDPALRPQASESPTAPPVAREGRRILDGEDVLAYAQGGIASGGQGLLVVNAALSQAREKLLGPTALPLLLAASRCTETDMGPRGLFELGESMRGAIRTDVTQHYLTGPTRNGVMRIAEDSRRVRATLRAFAGTPAR